MKKKYTNYLKTVRLFLLGTLTIAGCTRMDVDNDWKQSQLKGAVKSYFEVSYHAETKFGEVTKGRPGRESFLENDTEIIFDKKGHKTKEKVYFSDGTLSGQSTFKYDKNEKLIEHYISGYGKDTFEYDMNGNMVRETTFILGQDSLSELKLSKYDDHGLRTSLIGYKADGNLDFKIKYDYNKKGNKAQESYYDSKSNLYEDRFYDYDSDGNIIKERRVNFKPKSFFETRYKYDDHNNIIEELITSSGGLNSTHTYDYDENGNKIKQTNVVSDGLRWESTWKYKYDSYGNWVEKIAFEEGEAKFLLERTIKYYEE